MQFHQLRNRWFKFVVLLAGLLTGIFIFLSNESVPGHKELKDSLSRRLIYTRHLPIVSNNNLSYLTNMIYVMGGSEDDLNYRFKTAAELYKSGVARNIFILKEDSITEYDRLLGRNLTKAEWSHKKLLSLGIEWEAVVELYPADGYFGTLSEANSVSAFANERGYDHLLIVSSPYHTARIMESFTRYLRDKKIELYVYKSSDNGDLKELLIEYLKLVIYKNILLTLI